MTGAVAVALGLSVGMVMGLLGGGGSVLTVPALALVLGMSAQDATTGSLVIVGVTAAVAALGHARRGHTRWRAGLLLGLAGLPAAVVGTRLNRLVDPDVLLLAFAGLMLAAAVGMLVSRPEGDAGAVADAGPAATVRGSTGPRWLRVLAAGLLIGALTGFFGVGGGFVVVPVLVVLLGFAMPDAVGTSLIVIGVNAAVSLTARAGAGGVEWDVVGPFTVAAVLSALSGERVSGRLAASTLTRAFGLLLVVLACYVAVRSVLELVQPGAA